MISLCSRRPARPSLPGAIILIFFASVSLALAQPDTSKPAALLEQLMVNAAEIDTVEMDTAWQEDLRLFAAFGNAAIAPLVESLRAADTDQQKTAITYLMNVVISQARFSGEAPITIPSDLIDLLSETLIETDSLPLEANIVNIAGIIGPDAVPMAPAIISFLGNNSNVGARATAQAVLGRLGKGTLPLIHDELRGSTDERLRGDLAQILRGTKLPEDILEVLENLLRSDDPDVRKQAMIGLEGADADNDLVLVALIRNLADAKTDRDRVQAAYALTELDDPTSETVSALRIALGNMQNRSERSQLAQLLGTIQPEGIKALTRAASEATDGEARSDITRMLGMLALPDESIVQALLDIAIRSEDAESRQSALFGLRRNATMAVDVIEVAYQRTDDPDLRQSLEDLASAIRETGQ